MRLSKREDGVCVGTFSGRSGRGKDTGSRAVRGEESNKPEAADQEKEEAGVVWEGEGNRLPQRSWGSCGLEETIPDRRRRDDIRVGGEK